VGDIVGIEVETVAGALPRMTGSVSGTRWLRFHVAHVKLKDRPDMSFRNRID
jgi:hypothetical protein